MIGKTICLLPGLLLLTGSYLRAQSNDFFRVQDSIIQVVLTRESTHTEAVILRLRLHPRKTRSSGFWFVDGAPVSYYHVIRHMGKPAEIEEMRITYPHDGYLKTVRYGGELRTARLTIPETATTGEMRLIWHRDRYLYILYPHGTDGYGQTLTRSYICLSSLP
jgi:hypothetical protein